MLLAGALALAGCREPARPIRIGIAFPARNDPIAFMAADEANAAGAVRGRLVQIVHDTIPIEAEPADLEIQRAQHIVAQGPLVGVVGHGGSRGSLAAAPVYNEARVVHLVPTGTSRLLARAGEWTLTLAPNDSVEGAFIAGFVRERLRARTAAIFYVSDEYGVGLRDGVRSALGETVRLVREQRYDLASNLELLVDATLRPQSPDVIVVAGRTDAAGRIARRLAERGVATRVVAGDGAVVLPDLARVAGAGVRGDRVYAATFWMPSQSDSLSRRFTRSVTLRFQREATASDALIYDAVRLLIDAVRAAGEDPADVREWLLSLGRSRPRWRGVTGEIGFGAGAGPPRLVMGVVRNSSVVPVGAP